MYLDDADEIKEHAFFRGINWGKMQFTSAFLPNFLLSHQNGDHDRIFFIHH